jgi:hypothetical protein
VYKRRLSDSYHYSVSEACLEHGKPMMAEVLKFEDPRRLGELSTRGKFAVAKLEETGFLYVRNLLTCKSNVLKVPEKVKSDFQLKHVSCRN